MDIETLVRRHPRLYHMAEAGSIESIKRHGLLSTSALLDLFEVSAAERRAIESERRAVSVEITHSVHGRAVIRDQHPMTDSGLRRCLRDGLTPEEWYVMLNARVFFWVSEKRLAKLRGAAPYRAFRQEVLILDTARVVADYAGHITLTPMNTGATRPMPHPRGNDTFLPIKHYPYEERRRRGLEPLVEFAITGGVRNVERYIIDVRRVQGE